MTWAQAAREVSQRWAREGRALAVPPDDPTENDKAFWDEVAALVEAKETETPVMREVRLLSESYGSLREDVADEPRDERGRWTSGGGGGGLQTFAIKADTSGSQQAPEIHQTPEQVAAMNRAFDEARANNEVYGQIVHAAALRAGGLTEALHAPIKSEERATQKVAADYNGDWSRIHDLVRGSILVDREDQLQGAVRSARAAAEAAGWKLEVMKDRYGVTGENVKSPIGNYRDINCHLVSPDGFRAELQINTRPMFDAKETYGGHDAYVEQQNLWRNAGGAMNQTDGTRYDQLTDLQNSLYGAAHQFAQLGTTGGSD